MFKSPKQHHLLDRTKKEGKEHMKNDLYYAEDFKEGVSHFVEKREAKFTGK